MRARAMLVGAMLVGAMLVGAMLLGCGDSKHTTPRDLGPADLSAAMAAGDLGSPDASAALDMPARPCGEPLMQCCVDGNGVGRCNPATAACNSFGVCVACGVYPLACCPGGGCEASQTCIDDPSVGMFCYPCGHAAQLCCYRGPGCVEPGTSCVTTDGGAPRCG